MTSLMADSFVTWKVEFIDEWSNGKVLTTTARVGSNSTEEDMIEHWGLNKPDVKWYKLTKIED